MFLPLKADLSPANGLFQVYELGGFGELCKKSHSQVVGEWETLWHHVTNELN